MGTGLPWRELPAVLNKRRIAYARLRRPRESRPWHMIVDAIGGGENFEVLIIDIMVHTLPQASGAKNTSHQDIGRLHGGLSTKIHPVIGALGNPVRWILTAAT